LGPRWAIGNALEVLANDEIREGLLELAAVRRYGKAREMVDQRAWAAPHPAESIAWPVRPVMGPALPILAILRRWGKVGQEAASMILLCTRS
jgi:hypothetical protein